MESTKTIKSILADIVDELQNLRANQVLLAQHIDQGTGLLNAAIAKTNALEEVDSQYLMLRSAIERLTHEP